MPSNYIIKSKINSINKTKTITKAMELVSNSKLKKSKISLKDSLYYYNNINRIINNVLSLNIDHNHSYLDIRTSINNVGIIILSSDQGLCSNLNSNLFKIILKYMENNSNNNFFFYIIGNKANIFFNNIKNINIKFFEKIKNINFYTIQKLTHIISTDFTKKIIDKVILFSNNLTNNISYKTVSKVILPFFKSSNNITWDYIYEPTSTIVIDKLFARYIESKLYCEVLENIVCENHARMLSMNAATENASDMINSLKIEYNKKRQSAITQELSEIISGTEALS